MPAQPEDYDANLEANAFGPLPRSDGLLPDKARKSGASPSELNAAMQAGRPPAKKHGGGPMFLLGPLPEALKSTSNYDVSAHNSGWNIMGPLGSGESGSFDNSHKHEEIFPNLLGPSLGPQHGRASTDEQDDTHAALNHLLDPTLNDVQNQEAQNRAEEPDGQGDWSNVDHQSENEGSEGNPSKKRKTGTSRANMLTRGGACDFCKKRKLKCTAEQPTCSVCIRRGVQCVYTQNKQRSRVKVLEDRLVELERKLAGHSPDSSPATEPRTQTQPPVVAQIHNQQDQPSAESQVIITPEQDIASSDAATSSLINDLTAWEKFHSHHTTAPGAGLPLPYLGRDITWETIRIEPDLMTLADAAASDEREGFPWEGMAEEEIAGEIINACEGGQGVGGKIVTHLVRLYVDAKGIKFLHPFVDPSTLIYRLSPSSSSPPHSALLLGLMPLILPLSPSISLSAESSMVRIAAKLETAGRIQHQNALANVDPRVLDIIAASQLRTLNCYDGARLLEGWAEGSQTTALASAAGLSKLGGVGSRILGDEPDLQTLLAREKDQRKRAIRYRAALVPPPTEAKDLGQRVMLFWQVYVADKCASIGWGFPSSIDDEEISTPLPKTNYETPDNLRDSTTLNDFLQGRANTGSVDSDLCAQMKAMCLLYKATRLYGLPSSIATPEFTTQLKRVTRTYMSTLAPIKKMETSQNIGPRAQAWQLLYSTMVFLHLLEEIEAPRGGEEASESMTKAIDCAGKVVELVEILRRTGDSELMGCDLIMSVTCWMAVGKAIFKLAIWLEEEDEADKLAKKLRQWGGTLTSAARTVGKRSRFAFLMSQSLENYAMGYELTLGKYERTDFIG